MPLCPAESVTYPTRETIDSHLPIVSQLLRPFKICYRADPTLYHRTHYVARVNVNSDQRAHQRPLLPKGPGSVVK